MDCPPKKVAIGERWSLLEIPRHIPWTPEIWGFDFSDIWAKKKESKLGNLISQNRWRYSNLRFFPFFFQSKLAKSHLNSKHPKKM